MITWIRNNKAAAVIVVLAVVVLGSLLATGVLGGDDSGSGTYVNTTATPGTTATVPNPFAQVSGGACRAIQDYQLEDLPEVATSGSHIHVEYWWDGQPERETLLPTDGVDGGRFLLNRPLKGHVWEYEGCADDEVMAQILSHIERRLAGHANNKGCVEWMSTGLFTPAGGQGRTSPCLTSQTQNGSTGTCEPAVRKDRPLSADTLGKPFKFNDGGDWIIINGWTNEPGQNQAEFTVLLSPSDNPALLVGGSYYVRPGNCEKEAKAEFDQSKLPKLTLDQLKARGLVR